MAVAHHTPAPVLVDQARTPGDEPLDLGLDRLRQHAPGTLAQYRQQRIIGNAHSWPRQPDNAILLHGVSFLVTLNITEDTPPPASATKSSHSSAERSRFCQCSCSSCQLSVRRRTVVADKPGASGPSSAANASANWPVETPFR